MPSRRAMTVGDLIDRLMEFPPDAKLRVLIRRGLIEGIIDVHDVEDRAVIIPRNSR